MNSIEPYLFFGGRCEEAVSFYKQAVGAEVLHMLRFSDSPDPVPEGQIPSGWADKIMHVAFKIGKSFIMASDGCEANEGYKGFALTIVVPTPDEADRVFNALAEGGQITMPLDKTFWSPRFGMLTDRFGIHWMINTYTEEAQ